MSDLISPDLNIWEIGTEYNEKGSTVVEDWLKPESADWVYNFIANYPSDWWSQSTCDQNGVENVRHDPKNSEHLQNNRDKAQESFINGHFSYNFDRSTGHHASCDCDECKFKTWIRSPNTMKWVGGLAGEELKGTGELFISRYKEFQFLSPHHDTNKGKIGFVYNVTKDWKPEWGGMLHVMERNYRTISKVVMPKYNQLTIFNIPKSSGVPHYVSHVVGGVTNHRLSFTGWFS